jgi:hypothetical protein
MIVLEKIEYYGIVYYISDNGLIINKDNNVVGVYKKINNNYEYLIYKKYTIDNKKIYC